MHAQRNPSHAGTYLHLGLIGAAFICTSARASLTEFDDRAAWESAVGAGISVEDFNAFSSDVEFRSQPLALNGMVVHADISQLGASGNFIDAFPHLFNADIDGTTYLQGDVDGEGAEITFEFDLPATAWGADFLGSEGLLIDVFDDQDQNIGSLVATNGVGPSGPIIEFVGFHLSGELATHVVISKGFSTGANNDSFSMDNVGIAAIPEPSSLGVLALITAGLVLRLRTNQTPAGGRTAR